MKLKGDQKLVHYTKHPAMAQYPERIPRNDYGKNGGSNGFAHAQEWLIAVKENNPEMCYSHFDIAALDGDRVAGLRVIARRTEDRVGRPEDGCKELSAGCTVYTTARPSRLGSFLMSPGKANACGSARSGAKPTSHTVRDKLQLEEEAPSAELVTRLLKRQRVLVIVLGLSELNEATQLSIQPAHADFPADALVVTSRVEEALGGATKTVIQFCEEIRSE